MGKTRGRNIPVIRARIVEPGGAEDSSVHVIRKVVIVKAGNAGRKRAKRRKGVVEKPVSFRERER